MSKAEKLRYAVSDFDIEQMKPGARTIYDLLPDGKIIRKEYGPGSRKIRATFLYQATPAEFEQLCHAIGLCIESADRLLQYIDDSDAELIIYHDFGRVERMPRGLGNKETTVGALIEQYVFVTPVKV